jgi:hypothetical protein
MVWTKKQKKFLSKRMACRDKWNAFIKSNFVVSEGATQKALFNEMKHNYKKQKHEYDYQPI